MICCLIVPIICYDPNIVYMVAAGSLNVRSGPGTSNSVVRVVHYGDHVMFDNFNNLGVEQGWWGRQGDGTWMCTEIIIRGKTVRRVVELRGNCDGYVRQEGQDLCLRSCPSGQTHRVSGNNFCYVNCPSGMKFHGEN